MAEGDDERLAPSNSSVVPVVVDPRAAPPSSPPGAPPPVAPMIGHHDESTLEWLAVQSVCTVSIFAALLGYDIGVMSGALLPMSRDLHFTSSQEEVAVGCLNFVSAVGAVGGGFMYNKIGAVRCVRVAVILYALGMFVIACGYGFPQVFVGRLVCGVGVGLGFAICPQYIAEISPPAWRGVLVSCFEISINLGLCTGYLANLALERLSDSPRWRGLMLLPLLPTAIVNFAMVPRLPESPRWLMRDGTSAREAAAREVLVKTCGEAAAGPALEEIKQVIAAQNGAERTRGGYHRGEFDGEVPAEPGDKSPKPAGRGTWNALLSETVARRALLIGAGTAFFQQANGSEAAVYYVPQVLRAAGVRSEHSQLQAAALVGVCKTVCIVIGQFTVDVYGRRVMLLSSIAAVTGSLVMLAWCLGAGAAGGATAGITLAALCLFMMSFSLGVGPVTWVVTSEIFPLHVRSKGVAFSMALNRLTSGSVAMTFLSLVAAVGVGGAFAMFASASAAHFAFTFFMLPETKGKSLEEIEAALGAVSARQYERVPEQREEA
jgi:MFS family permease